MLCGECRKLHLPLVAGTGRPSEARNQGPLVTGGKKIGILVQILSKGRGKEKRLLERRGGTGLLVG